MPRAEKDKVNNINTVRLTSAQTDILPFFPPLPDSLCLSAASHRLTLLTLSVGPHIGRYCGQSSPGRVISYTGILSMTITTDNAIAKEGFSANYTIRERSLPPDYEEEGEELMGEGEERSKGGGDSGHLEEAVPLCFWIFPGCWGRMFSF